MRLSLWLLCLSTLMTGGCAFPCLNGACCSSGDTQFVPPATQFMEAEGFQQSACTSACDGCSTGSCRPKPYFTFRKYWPRLDKWTSTKMARRCADRNLLRQQLQCRKWISGHYKAGYRDAFVDVANGESGDVPAVPPPKYWNAHYRTEKGKRYVERYFDGYRAGAVQAAVELSSMTSIGASNDWSIQKTRARYVSTGPFTPGNYGQSCCPTVSWGTANEPSVFSLNPPQTTTAIGPAHSYPGTGNQSQLLTPDPGFSRSQNQYPPSTGSYGRSSDSVKPPPLGPDDSAFGPLPAAGLPNIPDGSLPAPGSPGVKLPAPGYANPEALPISPQRPEGSPSQPGYGNRMTPSQQYNGPLAPGFSGTLPSMALPGRLGPPDQFKSDPPVFQVAPPQR